MNIINKYKSVLQLGDGTILPPGVTTFVPGWDRLSKGAVVRAWLRAGVLVEAGEKPDPADLAPQLESAYLPPEEVAQEEAAEQEETAVDEKDELRARLDAAGIEYDKRWGVSKLRAALGE